MDIIKVVCGIIFKDDHVLICRRKPEKSLGGFWEFPGGKVEANETYEQCLIRELREELDLKVIIDRHFLNIVHQYERGTIELISFICESKESDIKLVDHDKIEWIPVGELLDRNLAPADIPIARELIETYANVK
jgi:8-oxo-dGTP diphosphatase